VRCIGNVNQRLYEVVNPKPGKHLSTMNNKLEIRIDVSSNLCRANLFSQELLPKFRPWQEGNQERATRLTPTNKRHGSINTSILTGLM
jgi:hypothetical protein